MWDYWCVLPTNTRGILENLAAYKIKTYTIFGTANRKMTTKFIMSMF